MRSPLAVGLTHPLNLVMLGAAVAAGLISAWWLFPVGLLFWLLMVVTMARMPEVRFRWRASQRAPLARRFERYFERISRAQLSVFNSLNAASGAVRRVLQPIQSEIDALTDQSHSLCVRMTTLENYRLVSQSKLDPYTDQRQIDSALRQAEGDAVVAREYQESQRSLQKHMSDLDGVAKQLDRVEAQLLSLANDLDSTVTEIFRLQTLEPRDADAHVPRLVERLRTQRQELRQFEREAIAMS